MAAFDINKNPQTLCDWVKNFRIKKIQMKRKLRSGGDLRVCAILSRALSNAEQELRRKQQERFNKWLEMQSKLSQFDNSKNLSNRSNCNGDNSNYYSHYPDYSNKTNDEEIKRRNEITDLWKYELSGLDTFMKNISSSNNTCSVQS